MGEFSSGGPNPPPPKLWRLEAEDEKFRGRGTQKQVIGFSLHPHVLGWGYVLGNEGGKSVHPPGE